MLAEKTWRPEAVARLMAGVFGTLCLGCFTAALLFKLIQGISEQRRQFFGLVLGTLFFQVASLFWIWLFLREEKTSWGEAFGLSTPNQWRAIGLGVLTGIVVLPFLLGLQQLSALLLDYWNHSLPSVFKMTAEPQTLVKHLEEPGLAILQKIYFGIVAIVIAPVAEESIFRGILYPVLKTNGYPRIAMWGTAVLFGLSHINSIAFLPLTVFGLLLILLYEETNNLLAPIVAHSFFNAINFVVLIFKIPVGQWLGF